MPDKNIESEFIEGQIIRIIEAYRTAYVEISYDKIYYIHPFTIGINFSILKKGDMIKLEISEDTSRVLGAELINK